ncbi:ATP-binding protein [Cellulosilyticum ruminicola]|uniref:ATP-binding protein n=1 Tax=Cellulosilyticum ruminicola TaxID=425254 RepID=UPI0006D2BC07|nr:ATP-binding protein [Cellulosilyticum ruminicola]
MKDLSLHILDIVENSIRAGATLIEITVSELTVKNQLVIEIKDNGKGMPAAMCQSVTSPFVTTRSTRKVGLGLPLLAHRCELCEGQLHITSEEGKGTMVTAQMCYSHIDRTPLGDIGSTMMTLIMGHPEIQYIYTYIYERKEKQVNSFQMNTNKIKEILGDVEIQKMEILLWLKDYINENMILACEKIN